LIFISRANREYNPITLGDTLASLRIFVADEHDIVRRGIVSLLGSQPGWEICGEAADGQEAIEKVAQLRPDIVLLDVDMPKMDGLDAVRQIAHNPPFPKVLLLATTDVEQLVREALEAGVRGLVLKTYASVDLVSAVDVLQRRRIFFPPRTSELIVQGYLKGPTAKSVGEPENAKVLDEPSGLLPRRWKKTRIATAKYAAIAALIVGTAAIGWYTYYQSALQLPMVDKMLVRVGLKTLEPPTYTGNPDTKVWIDLHTGLYYCPGADLYGKTGKGKYEKQREAQEDRFEPAARKPCN
jgi:DNA-binding NarL/FixJ family response regulator